MPENNLLITEFSEATTDQIKPGKAYDFQVVARNKKGLGDPSETVTIEASGKPFPPTSIEISFSRETASTTVSWTVGNDNGSPLISS